MIRDPRVFMLKSDCLPITSAINSHRHASSLNKEIAIFKLYNDASLGCLIISVSDDIDRIVQEKGGIEQYDTTYIRLRETPNWLTCIFGDKELAEFLPYVVPNSPQKGYANGASKLEYTFYVFNINDEVKGDSPGIYIFTTTKVDEDGIDKHIFNSYVSVAKNNQEEIHKAKQEGAKHFWFYYSGSDEERQRIIKDIQEGEKANVT